MVKKSGKSVKMSRGGGRENLWNRVNIRTWFIIFLVVFVLSQVSIVYLIYSKIGYTLSMVSSSEDKLNERIFSSNIELQGKLNIIAEGVSSLSTKQTDLKEQLSEVKAETSSDFSGIIEDEIEGVVTIKTDVSQGSGFLIKDTGYLVTNAHVISGASSASVITSDGKAHAVALIGVNSLMDIALLKIEGVYHSLDLGNSNDVKIGEKVIAIGNPLGLSFTATEGIISARDRKGINNMPYYFQTDVSLNPGNSGGPLINTKGEVIAINNFKISEAENIGFSLEINEAKDAINEISFKEMNETII
jgi:S1-C subfamily serine protease